MKLEITRRNHALIKLKKDPNFNFQRAGGLQL